MPHHRDNLHFYGKEEEGYLLAQTLAVYDKTSSINQTIKERAAKHVWNLWREPRLIYGRYQKRGPFPSKLFCCLIVGKLQKCHFPKCNHNICNWCIIAAFTRDPPYFPHLSKPHAIYEQFLPKLGFPIRPLFAILGSPSSHSHVSLYSIHHSFSRQMLLEREKLWSSSSCNPAISR